MKKITADILLTLTGLVSLLELKSGSPSRILFFDKNWYTATVTPDLPYPGIKSAMEAAIEKNRYYRMVSSSVPSVTNATYVVLDVEDDHYSQHLESDVGREIAIKEAEVHGIKADNVVNLYNFLDLDAEPAVSKSIWLVWSNG